MSSKIRGGYTIEHGVGNDFVGTPPPNESLVPDSSFYLGDNALRDHNLGQNTLHKNTLGENPTTSPQNSSDPQLKSEKKIFEKTKDPLDKTEKPKRIIKKRGPGRKAKILPRHRAVLSEMQENGGKITKAMIALQYADTTIKNPTLVTQSKSWKMLMDENLPEDLIAQRHSELLNKRARRNIRDSNGNIVEYDVDDGPDTAAVVKGLELAYKLRGSFAAEKQNDNKNVIYNLFYKPEVREAMRSFEDNLKKQIADEANSNTKNAVYDVVGEEVGPTGT